MYTLLIEYDYMDSWYDFPYEWTVYGPSGRQTWDNKVASGSAISKVTAYRFAKRKIRRHAKHNELEPTFTVIEKEKR